MITCDRCKTAINTSCSGTWMLEPRRSGRGTLVRAGECIIGNHDYELCDNCYYALRDFLAIPPQPLEKPYKALSLGAKFKHHHSCCKYIVSIVKEADEKYGNQDERYDVWYCPDSKTRTIGLRFGDVPHECYEESMNFDRIDHNYIYKAVQLAKRMVTEYIDMDNRSSVLTL